MRVVLVPGTWANSRAEPNDQWWKLGSPFANELTRRGYEVLSFAWDTHLDGVVGEDEDWQTAGERFYRTVPADSIVITHSHGAQPAIIGISFGLSTTQLLTIAAPVRSDVPYDKSRPYIGQWTCIYGNYEDWVQIAGELTLGRFGVLRRKTPLADLYIQYPATHSELHDVAVWNKQNWWSLLKGS